MPARLQLPTQLAVPSDWDEAAEVAKVIPAMTEAVAYFRRVLGEHWSGWRQRFHLARSFYTSIQGNVREWVRFHRLAHALADVRHHEFLVHDLGERTWTKHLAATQALEFCGRLHAAGRRVQILQPTHDISPDTRVWLDDRPVTVEFKALHDPDAQAPWDAFGDALNGGLVLRGIHMLDGWFPFEIALYPPALDRVEAILDALAEQFAARELAWRALRHGAGHARFVADPEDTARGWHLPVGQRGDLARVAANLGSKWIRQLRGVDGPTVLVVLTQDLLFVPDARTRDEAGRAARALREALRERPVPSAVLLHEEPFLAPPLPGHVVAEGWRFARGPSEGRYRAALLVEHPAPRAALTAAEIDPLVGPTMRW